MSDRDHIVNVKLNYDKAVTDYERLKKKFYDIDRKYATKKAAQTKQIEKDISTSKSSSGGGPGKPVSQGVRATNMDVRMESALSDLSRSRIAGGDNRAVDAQIAKVKLLRAELKRVGSQRELSVLAEKYRRANTETRKLLRNQEKYNKSLQRTNPLIAKMGSSFKRMGLAGASAYALLAGGTKVFNIGMEMDGMRASLLAASDSAENASENFEFLKKTAMEMGSPLRTGITGFNRIGIAAKGMGISVQQAQQMFKNISKATVASSLSADKTNLVYLALSQMMSKGKVSAEELNRQMAEQMPFAMEAAKKATGKTAGEIFKLMEQGKLLSKDFVIPFTEAMGELAERNGAYEAATKKVRAEMNRVSVAFDSMIDDIFQDGGGADFFAEIFRNIVQLMEGVGPVIKEFLKPILSFAETLMFVGRKMKELIGFMFQASWVTNTIKMAWIGLKAVFIGIELIFLNILDSAYAIAEVMEKINPFSSDTSNLTGGSPTRSSNFVGANIPGLGGNNAGIKTTNINVGTVVADNPMEFMDKMNAMENM